jgi:hypothetical protein
MDHTRADGPVQGRGGQRSMVRRGGADPGRDRTQKECCRVPRLRTSGSRKRILSVESFPLSNANETLVCRSVSNSGRRTDRCPSARWFDGFAASSKQPKHSVAGAYAARCSAPSANTAQQQSHPAAVGRGTTGLVADAVHAVGPGRRHCLYIYVRTASGYPGHRPRCLGRAVSLSASMAASPRQLFMLDVSVTLNIARCEAEPGQDLTAAALN